MKTTLDDRATTISPTEAARRLGCTVGTLRNRRWRGDGPAYVRIGSRVRYRLLDVATFIEERVRYLPSDPEVER
jgi:hypothetical protein